MTVVESRCFVGIARPTPDAIRAFPKCPPRRGKTAAGRARTTAECPGGSRIRRLIGRCGLRDGRLGGAARRAHVAATFTVERWPNTLRRCLKLGLARRYRQSRGVVEVYLHDASDRGLGRLVGACVRADAVASVPDHRVAVAVFVPVCSDRKLSAPFPMRRLPRPLAHPIRLPAPQGVARRARTVETAGSGRSWRSRQGDREKQLEPVQARLARLPAERSSKGDLATCKAAGASAAKLTCSHLRRWPERSQVTVKAGGCFDDPRWRFAREGHDQSRTRGWDSRADDGDVLETTERWAPTSRSPCVKVGAPTTMGGRDTALPAVARTDEDGAVRRRSTEAAAKAGRIPPRTLGTRTHGHVADRGEDAFPEPPASRAHVVGAGRRADDAPETGIRNADSSSAARSGGKI